MLPAGPWRGGKGSCFPPAGTRASRIGSPLILLYMPRAAETSRGFLSHSVAGTAPREGPVLAKCRFANLLDTGGSEETRAWDQPTAPAMALRPTAPSPSAFGDLALARPPPGGSVPRPSGRRAWCALKPALPRTGRQDLGEADLGLGVSCWGARRRPECRLRREGVTSCAECAVTRSAASSASARGRVVRRIGPGIGSPRAATTTSSGASERHRQQRGIVQA